MSEGKNSSAARACTHAEGGASKAVHHPLQENEESGAELRRARCSVGTKKMKESLSKGLGSDESTFREERS